MRRHRYGDCSFCGGAVKSQKVIVDYRWKDKFYVFKDVPAGVCQQCGEQYFTAKVAKKLEAMVEKKAVAKKTILVPLVTFPRMAVT